MRELARVVPHMQAPEVLQCGGREGVLYPLGSVSVLTVYPEYVLCRLHDSVAQKGAGLFRPPHKLSF